jgi:hypothetical protein
MRAKARKTQTKKRTPKSRTRTKQRRKPIQSRDAAPVNDLTIGTQIPPELPPQPLEPVEPGMSHVDAGEGIERGASAREAS